MERKDFDNITFADFKWLNEPKKWQGTLHHFYLNTGHLYGVEIKDDFAMTVCVETDFKELYDQAGLMIYNDEKHWVKAGMELNDGIASISSVATDGLSDWGIGIFTGDPRKFYLRLTKKPGVVSIKYSADKETWHLLRLCPYAHSGPTIVGPMTCTPKRAGLDVKFSQLKVTEPQEDIIHDN